MCSNLEIDHIWIINAVAEQGGCVFLLVAYHPPTCQWLEPPPKKRQKLTIFCKFHDLPNSP